MRGNCPSEYIMAFVGLVRTRGDPTGEGEESHMRIFIYIGLDVLLSQNEKAGE